VDPGLVTDKVLTARLSLGNNYPESRQRVDFFKQLVDGIQNRQAITAAGAVSVLPLTGNTEDWAFSVENYLPANGRPTVTEQTRFVEGRYFQALGIPLQKGRLFEASDNAGAARIAIISEAFARKYWKDDEPIGKRIRLATQRGDSPWITVVGVVGDIRHLGLHIGAQPFVYYPMAHHPQSRMALVVRSDSAPSTVTSIIREEVSRLDREQAIFSVKTMEEYAGDSIGQFRFTSLILTSIGILALTLATVGIYGLMAFSISQRSHEMGVRMALGARRSQIFRHVVGQGLVLAAIGIVLGIVGGSLVSRAMQSQLFGVEPFDLPTLAGSAAVLFGVALFACYFPARRATRIQPSAALRFE
jgi:putative ABC transport system permease protein